MTRRDVDSQVLRHLAQQTARSRGELEATFNTARRRVDGAPGGWDRGRWEGIPSFMRMELESLDREQRELNERAAKIETAAAIAALPEPLPLSAWKFILAAVTGLAGWAFASAADVQDFVAKVAAFSKQFAEKNGRNPNAADFAAFGAGPLQSGFNAAARRATELSDGVALSLFGGAFPVLTNGASSLFRIGGEGGLKGLVFGGRAGQYVEVERHPDGTFRVRVTESLGGSASLMVGAEGGLRVNEHQFKAGASGEAGGQAKGTRSTTFSFNPKTAGDMSKMASLLAGAASPVVVGGIRPFPPNLEDNVVEFEIGGEGGVFAEGHASSGSTSAGASAAATAGATRRKGEHGWEMVYQSDVRGEATFSHLGLAATVGESYASQRIVRDTGQEIIRHVVTTSDRSLAESVAQASFVDHERFVIEEDIDARTGETTIKIYAEDDSGISVEASAKVGLKAHLGIEGAAEFSSGTRRLVYEGTR